MAKEEVKEVKKEDPKSAAYLELEAIIEAYKKSNPTKYLLKKAELDKKLAALR